MFARPSERVASRHAWPTGSRADGNQNPSSAPRSTNMCAALRPSSRGSASPVVSSRWTRQGPFLIAERIEDPPRTVLAYGHGGYGARHGGAVDRQLSPWDADQSATANGTGARGDNKGQHSINLRPRAGAQGTRASSASMPVPDRDGRGDGPPGLAKLARDHGASWRRMC